MEGQDEISFPKDLLARLADRDIAKTLRDERLTFESRKLAYLGQIDELERTKRLAANEVKYADVKHGVLDVHVARLQSALEVLDGLAAKGQSLAVDRLNLAQRIVDYEMTRADIELAIARSREDIARTERSLDDLRRQRRNEILTDLSETQARLQDLAEKEAALHGKAAKAGTPSN